MCPYRSPWVTLTFTAPVAGRADRSDLRDRVKTKLVAFVVPNFTAVTPAKPVPGDDNRGAAGRGTRCWREVRRRLAPAGS